MLDMGFIRDVRKIVAACRKERQTLLFSATMPSDIAKLAAEILRDPVRVEVTPAKVTADRIEQRVYFVPAQAKRALLTELLADPAMDRVLVFTRTKRGADRVCRTLQQAGVVDGSPARQQGAKCAGAGARRVPLGPCRASSLPPISPRAASTSSGISHVINYELPNEPESYVHRIGRTARAGAGGSAIAFCDPSERPYLQAIERLMRVSVPVAPHRLAHARTYDLAAAAAGAGRRQAAIQTSPWSGAGRRL